MIDRAFDADPANRVDSIEHEELDLGLRGGFEAEPEGRDIGVEAAADVLDVKDQGVEVGQLRGSGTAVGSVEAVDDEARLGVGGVVDLFVEFAGESVLGTEEGRRG